MPEVEVRFDLQRYIRKEDCEPKTVDSLLELGFKLHSITPVQELIYKSGNLLTSNTKLIYHFILEETK
jgi:hypothetical protein